MISFIVCLLCITGMILQGFFIAADHKKSYARATLLKGMASVMFVMIGSIAYTAGTDREYSGFVLLGLIFGATGDILLHLQFLFRKGQLIFIAGVVVFLAGHIMYVAALIPYSDRPLITVIIGTAVAAAIMAYLCIRYGSCADMRIKAFGSFYIEAISLMTAFGVINFISYPQPWRMMFALGAVLFIVSDIILTVDIFANRNTLARSIINLSFYYAAQLLIAFTIFLVS